MTLVELTTERPFELLDVTDAVDAVVSGDGLVHIWCPHTSCGLAVTELEDGLHEDIEATFERVAPTTAHYAHDDMARRHQNIEPDERRNGWSHIRGLLGTMPFVIAPVADGRLALGRWQRLFLVELDGPRARRTLRVTPIPN